jgi:uncharacterized protein
MNEQIERRFVAHGLMVEQRADGKMPMLKGYAAVFNLPSVELWGFYEQIAPGAFADSIAAGDEVKALWNHDPNWVMASSGNGTLRLKEDDRGLAVEFDPLDTPIMRGFVASIERGDVSQMSFAMRTLEDKWDIDEEERYKRTVLKAKLYDVSPVAYPAYPQTEIGLRSAGQTVDTYGYVPRPPELDGQEAAEIARRAAARARLQAMTETDIQLATRHMREE